jgi:histidinol phosphatase-like enzyme
MEYQAVFIDRDGTLGGSGHFKHPKEFSSYPYSEEALSMLKIIRIR